MIKCKFDSYYAIGKQYNVMVTCNAHNLVIGSSNLSTALKEILKKILKENKMNYSSMVEQSTHNGCISVQFWVIQERKIK